MNSLLTAIFSANTTNIRKFPGCLPVSLSREMAKALPFGYVFSPKADGVRAFMVVDDKLNAFLLFRDNTTQLINVVKNDLEHNSPDAVVNRFLTNRGLVGLSVFDIELFDGTKKQISIFDAIMVRSKPVVALSHHVRLAMAYKFVEDYESKTEEESTSVLAFGWSHPELGPYMMPRVKNPGVVMVIGNYDVGVKAFFVFQHAAKALPLLARYQTHGTDGFIFQRLFVKYTTFRNSLSSVLKWKPLTHITIDFRVTSHPPGNKQLDKLFGASNVYTTDSTGNVVLSVTPLSVAKELCPCRGTIRGEEVLQYVNTICEFSWDQEARTWKFVMPRPKKKSPNKPATVVATMKNLDEAIDVNELFGLGFRMEK